MTTSYIVKPMLAGKATDKQIAELLDKFGEMYASPKLDGIRCTIQNGIAYSRSLKPIRNEYIQSILGGIELYNGLDGELIVGSSTAHDVYRTTTSNVMRSTGEPDFKFYIFDNSMDFKKITLSRQIFLSMIALIVSSFLIMLFVTKQQIKSDRKNYHIEVNSNRRKEKY